LLDDDSPPAAGRLLVGQASALHLLEHHRERRRRDRQVEDRVAADTVTGLQAAQLLGEPVEPGVVVERAPDEPDRRGQAVPGLLAEGRARALLGALPGELDERLVALPVAAGEAQQHEPGRQQAAVGQVVHGRDQLLAGKVSGDTEHHQCAGVGEPGEPAVSRIAQRVSTYRGRHLRFSLSVLVGRGYLIGRGCRCCRVVSRLSVAAFLRAVTVRPGARRAWPPRPGRPWLAAGPAARGHRAASWPRTASSSWFQESSNFDTPSRSRTSMTSSMSTPTLASAAITLWASA